MTAARGKLYSGTSVSGAKAEIKINRASSPPGNIPADARYSATGPVPSLGASGDRASERGEDPRVRRTDGESAAISPRHPRSGRSVPSIFHTPVLPPSSLASTRKAGPRNIRPFGSSPESEDLLARDFTPARAGVARSERVREREDIMRIFSLSFFFLLPFASAIDCRRAVSRVVRAYRTV